MSASSPFQAKSPAPWSLFRLGMLSALCYLLAFTLPYWLPNHYLNVKDEIYQLAAKEPWRGILFYAALAALFGFYLAACRLVAGKDRRQSCFWMVGAWALVFCFLLIPVQPLTSSDVYGYIFQGRIVAVLGQNPFAHLYQDFAADPFFPLVTFRGLPATTGYGPLWVALESLLGWLARDRLLLNLLLFKGLAAGLHLAGSVLVYAALERLDPERSVAGMLFYAWNPLLLHELVGNAHNDGAVAFLALLGFYLLSRSGLAQPQRWNRFRWGLLAVPCLVLAALVKPVALLWLPLVGVWVLAQNPGWRERIRQVGAMALLVLVPTVVFYVPFWVGTATFHGLLAQTDIHGNSLPHLLISALGSLWPDAGERIVQGVKLVTVAGFAPFYAWQLWKARQDVLRAAFGVMLFYLLFVGFQFMPWYVTWLLVPAALLADPLRQRVALVLSMLAPLLYFPFGWQWARDHCPSWSVALAAALPLLALGGWLIVRARRRAAA